MKLPNHKLLIPLAIAITTFIFTFAWNYRSQLPVHPLNKTAFEFDPETESRSQTNITQPSKALIDSSHGHLHFQYKIESAESQPKLVFHAPELAKTLDLSKYNHIEIETDSLQNEDFTVVFYMYIPGFSDPADISTHRPYAFKCRADSINHSFKLPIREFATPLDWFTKNNLDLEDIPETDWKQMTHMAFMDYSGAPHPQPKQLTLSEIQFHSSPIKAAKPAAIAALIALIISALLVRLQPVRSKKVIKSAPAQEPVYTDELITYLKKNFCSQTLTLEQIKEELQLSQSQVNTVIKSHFNVGYKQYLTTLRMEEAKRLLMETELPIGTVGEQVGYIYPNSFARTFRQFTGIAPNEFRQNASSAQ